MTGSNHYSFDCFDASLVRAIEILQPKTILDIGAGDGKVAAILRASPLLQDVHITALEPDKDCNAKLRAAGYNDIINAMTHELYRHHKQKYDVVIMGDVIEHLTHGEGRDLLEFLLYRSGYILIVTPDCMPMIEDEFHIGHNSQWRPTSFYWCDLWAMARLRVMFFYILRGYQNWDMMALQYLVEQLNVETVTLKSCHADYPDETLQLIIHANITSDPVPGNDLVRTVYRPS